MRTPRVHPILTTALAAGTAGALLLGTTGPASAVTAPDAPLAPGLAADREAVGAHPAAFTAVAPALAEEGGFPGAEPRILPVPDVTDTLERLDSLVASIMDLVAALPEGTSGTESSQTVETIEMGADAEPVIEGVVDDLVTNLLAEIDDFVAALLSGLVPDLSPDDLEGIEGIEGIGGGGLDEDFPIEPLPSEEGTVIGEDPNPDLNALGNLIDLLEAGADPMADPMDGLAGEPAEGAVVDPAVNPAAAGSERTAKVAPFLRPALPVAEIREP
ncbi:hypothetical protein GCM10027160_36970 [Streptomyces calidiresistens]|uniref:Uncharacterized protein n=1 Tax=Streptomyces calidiresistens TaxID=1485586 RepID=A0A7W3XV19_9ACTN|nr:hypothetical protein [Streptomyces calidiresistens]MBB0228277.1 hypothetical protein [Streptomyces calidiresistens]